MPSDRIFVDFRRTYENSKNHHQSRAAGASSACALPPLILQTAGACAGRRRAYGGFKGYRRPYGKNRGKSPKKSTPRESIQRELKPRPWSLQVCPRVGFSLTFAGLMKILKICPKVSKFPGSQNSHRTPTGGRPSAPRCATLLPFCRLRQVCGGPKFSKIHAKFSNFLGSLILCGCVFYPLRLAT